MRAQARLEPQAKRESPFEPSTFPVAAGVIAAAAVLLGAGAWYVRRARET